MRPWALLLLQGALGTVLAPLIAQRKGHRRREWLVAGLMLGLLAVPLALALTPRAVADRPASRTDGAGQDDDSTA